MATEQERIHQLKHIARPATPGDVLADLLENRGLTQSEIAQRLGISRATIHRVIQGQRAITPDLANRLARLFGNSAAFWLRLQQQVDLWDALHQDEAAYAEIQPLQAA